MNTHSLFSVISVASVVRSFLGCGHAALLDYADLDGNLPIANECLSGVQVKTGTLALPDDASLGPSRFETDAGPPGSRYSPTGTATSSGTDSALSISRWIFPTTSREYGIK